MAAAVVVPVCVLSSNCLRRDRVNGGEKQTSLRRLGNCDATLLKLSCEYLKYILLLYVSTISACSLRRLRRALTVDDREEGVVDTP